MPGTQRQGLTGEWGRISQPFGNRTGFLDCQVGLPYHCKGLGSQRNNTACALGIAIKSLLSTPFSLSAFLAFK